MFHAIGKVLIIEDLEPDAAAARAATVNRIHSSQGVKMIDCCADDGYLKLRRDDLGGIALSHLISGLDDELPQGGPQCGSMTPLSGYTEWVCAHQPLLSIGWDWEWRPFMRGTGVVRLGLPRTNILVISNASSPLPWQESLEVLARFIDALAWQKAALEALGHDG